MKHAIKTSLGGDFFPGFRDEADIFRSKLQCDGNNLRRVSHLEIEFGRDGFPEPGYILVLNVPAVLPQMSGDPGGTAALGGKRGNHRIGLGIVRRWIAGVAGLTDGGNVIDIDAEQGRHCVK